MIKIIDPASFAFHEPVAMLVELHSRGPDKDWMTKRAALFTKEIAALRPEPGHSFIHLTSLGAGETYSCFPGNTEVRMADGSLRKIMDIKVGEKVVNRWGKPDEVLSCFVRPYKGSFVSLAVAGMLDAVQTTPNHKFFVIPKEQVECHIDKADHCKPGTFRNNGVCSRRTCPRTHLRFAPEMRSAENLRAEDYVLQVIPDCGIGARTWEWSVPMARLLGYFLAEGSFIKTKTGEAQRYCSGMSFAFGETEAATLVADLKMCAEQLRTHYGKVSVSGPYFHKGAAVVQVRSLSLTTRVRQAVGEYSYGKQLNGEVYWQSPENLKHLVACWFDGDGTHPQYLRPNGYEENRYTGGTVSRRLALDLQWLLGRLNAPAAVCLATEAGERIITGTIPSKTRDLYHISFSNAVGEFMAGISTKHRSVPPLQEKAHSFIWNGFVCRPIRSIEHMDVNETVYNLEVADDHTYTVGNGLVVSNCNRNGDYFNEAPTKFPLPFPKDASVRELDLVAGLVNTHPTFLQGHVFKHHRNDNPAGAIGKIAAQAYNHDMHRGELIIKVPHGREWDADLQKIASGGQVPFSMATRVPYDYCSGCGNRARSRAEYCEHLRDHLTDIIKTGHQIFAVNDEGSFFDISKVFKPADRIAWSFRKVASILAQGGAALAEEYGLRDDPTLPAVRSRRQHQKMALARKLGAIEKHIEAMSVPDERLQHLSAAVPSHGLGDGELRDLRQGDLSGVLRELGDSKIALSLPDFVKLVRGPDASQAEVPEASELVPHLLSKLSESRGSEDLAGDGSYDAGDELVPPCVGQAVQRLAEDMSLAHGPAVRRVSLTIIRGGPLEKSSQAPGKTLKTAAEDPRAGLLANEYVKYLLSFRDRAGEDPQGNLDWLTVLSSRSTI